MRCKRFTFLCNEEERWLIAALAKRLQRSQSDAVRFVVITAAQDLNISKEKNHEIPFQGLMGVEDG